MNKLVVALAVSTATCAAAALYFRHQLIEERMASARAVAEATRAPAYLPASAPAVPAPARAAPAQPSVATQAVPPVVTKPAPVSAARAAENPEALQPLSDSERSRVLPQAAGYLAKYESEQGRAELRERQLARARESLSGFDKQRNLDAATWEKLINLIADQELDKQAMGARCVIDPLCVMPLGLGQLQAENRQAVAQLIGEDGYKEMQNWRAAEPSRRATSGLSARLPAQSALSSSQSTALTAALQGERSAFMRDYRSAGQHVVGFTSIDGMSVMYADRATPEERTMSAQNYVQRSRDRAATILRGEQLTVFNQMQDELLLDLERHLRRKDRKP